ncbi:MAG: GAF domain-containing protein, partial [Anaerolineales bacterium]
AAVAIMLVLMAYPVAYYGVSYPDRVVKSRLFEWLLRGPVVASTILAVMVTTNRLGLRLGIENTRAVPLAMVASLLLLQYAISWIRPTVERWLFYGQDRNDVSRLHLLEERLLTTGDLRQFLEAVLNSVSNLTGAPSAFVAALGNGRLDLEVAVGPDDPLRGPDELPQIVISENAHDMPPLGTLFAWNGFWLLPLRGAEGGEVFGLLGFQQVDEAPDLDTDEKDALKALADRAAVALSQRRLQKEVFAAVDRLVPQAEEIQRLRAAARFAGGSVLDGVDRNGLRTEADLAHWVREALGHYWGGPRLTRSPLLGLEIVRRAMLETEGNPVNALRSILRQAMDQVRPEGERRFTGDWMLYNILEMKFLEGRKVRDIALRLAMSEADLYRKQRVAIEAVAKAIAEMERAASRSPAA